MFIDIEASIEGIHMINKTSENIYEFDMGNISNLDFIPWNKLNNTSIFVTGATGLIGWTVINALLYAAERKNLRIKVFALVRDMEKAEKRFSAILNLDISRNLSLIKGDIENLPIINEHINYIIHCASPTSSKTFVQKPVETIQSAVYGTNNILQLAYKNKVDGMIYLSSMEVYGYPNKGHIVREDDIGALSPLNIRNSSSLGKQLCELLCCSFYKEYGVPVKIIRLTQTFGPGVRYDDGRIFAEFGRCLMEGKDIILKTKGETERSYLYSADAISAIILILLKGKSGEAYNAADEHTYCSIADMANLLADYAGLNVLFNEDESQNGYLNVLYMNLDTSRLKELGWSPSIGPIGESPSTLINMYLKMCQYWEMQLES